MDKEGNGNFANGKWPNWKLFLRKLDVDDYFHPLQQQSNDKKLTPLHQFTLNFCFR